MESPTTPHLTRGQRRRGIALGLLRALAAAAALLTVYFLAPLDRVTAASMLAFMVAGLLVLVALTGFQVWAIFRAKHPGVRAVEALATTVPLFLLVFSATYFMMSHTNAGSFSTQALTRIDSLYFTVTVFSTVGFGDISPASQAARLVVTGQIILNLIVLGFGVRLIAGAAQQARQGSVDGGNRDRDIA